MKFPFAYPFLQAAFALCAFHCVQTLSAQTQKLFNGHSFDGWQGNIGEVWRIEDGVILGGSMEGNPRNEFLATEKSYANFHLTLEYKLVGTEGFVNGGVQIRSQRPGHSTSEMVGYQADIGHGYSGSLYDEERRRVMLVEADSELIKSIERPGEWNYYEVVALGSQVEIFLNGRRTASWVETDDSIVQDGVIALQIHGNCKAVISFRNIEIEELPEPKIPGQAVILSRFGDGQPQTAFDAFEDGKFNLTDGETVVFVGQENFVREQESGELEALLAASFSETNPRFRSMAWEADTVYRQWRYENFGSWNRQLETAEASVVIAQFGQMEAFDGPDKISSFEAAYHQLLDQFAEQTQRIVLVSPMPFERPQAPLAPDLTELNQDTKAYAEAVRRVAEQRNAVFVDLFTPLSQKNASKERLTHNGIHLNDTGLRVVAQLINEQLSGKDASKAELEDLRQEIIAKNQLWFDCWRPANWSFVYGDRISQKYGTAAGNEPSLRESFAERLPLIEEADTRIQALARGNAIETTPPEPEPPAAKESDFALSPAQEQETFTVAEGYEVNLFAAEPEGVSNPVQIAWDEKGRLYVACSPSYPQSLAADPKRDYIVVLEDTDGDGQADKSWRFAEGLTMIQGLEPGPGGLYVCDFDQLVFLADQDGDGRADARRVIFSGFGIGDTHQLLNSISHGDDGSLWITQGAHAISAVESPWGIRRLDRAGVWRFRPRTLLLEPFFDGGMAGANNWGVAIDDYGQVFHKTGDRPEGYWTVPGLVHNARPLNPDDKAETNQIYANSPEQYHSVGPLFSTELKTTSLDIIGTEALPDDVQGTALLAGFMASNVELHRFHDEGSGFRTTQLPKLMTSTTDAFRPVDVSVGPDGAIYLADWYNPVIGHYQASYADPRRDKKHGRIWRITSKIHQPVSQPNLAAMSSAKLLDQLRSPERWTRYQAKRLLYYKPSKEVIKAANKWVKSLSTSDADYERLLLEAAGVHRAHEDTSPKILDVLVNSDDYRIRSYGALLTGYWAHSLSDPLGILDDLVKDEHPRVRLCASIAASYYESPKSIAVALSALDYEMDPFLEYAVRQSARALQPHWEPALQAADLKLKSKKHSDYLEALFNENPPPASPGAEIYSSACMVCHQTEGNGLKGMYPPLANSDWVTGDQGRLIQLTLHGLKGPLHVNGQLFEAIAPVEMPAFKGLSDQEIADVLSYIRGAFGNDAPPVSAKAVKAARTQSKDRSTPWTEAELSPR